MKFLCINALADNYIWVLYNKNNEAIAIDCGDFAPLKTALEKYNLKLKYILLTHHHYDHIDGVFDAKNYDNSIKIVGNKNHKDLLPPLDIEIDAPIDMEQNKPTEITLLNETISVFLAQGHCRDHIIYHFNSLNYLFVGDVLFSLGSGKIFEGTVSQALQSFELVKTFKDDVNVFCGHNYNLSNLAFTKSLGFFNFNGDEEALLQKGNEPTLLGFEKAKNPFLNINNANFKKHLKQENSTNEEFYNYIRLLKVSFSRALKPLK
jgi:hydroxyacylglutathione hydrolase